MEFCIRGRLDIFNPIPKSSIAVRVDAAFHDVGETIFSPRAKSCKVSIKNLRCFWTNILYELFGQSVNVLNPAQYPVEGVSQAKLFDWRTIGRASSIVFTVLITLYVQQKDRKSVV